MKSTSQKRREALPQCLDIRQPEQAERLSEAYARERRQTLAALEELGTMRYADQASREETALNTMRPMPGQTLMRRAPREILRLRAALFLVSCHSHRQN